MAFTMFNSLREFIRKRRNNQLMLVDTTAIDYPISDTFTLSDHIKAIAALGFLACLGVCGVVARLRNEDLNTFLFRHSAERVFAWFE